MWSGYHAPMDQDSASSAPRRTCAALIDDLLFLSQVQGTAREVNVDLWVKSSPQGVLKLLADQPFDCIIVDLECRAEPFELIRQAKQQEATRAIPLVAFASPEKTDLLQQAKELGANEALSRSNFTQRLPGFLQGR